MHNVYRLAVISLGMKLGPRPVLKLESCLRARKRSQLWRGLPPWHKLPRCVGVEVFLLSFPPSLISHSISHSILACLYSHDNIVFACVWPSWMWNRHFFSVYLCGQIFEQVNSHLCFPNSFTYIMWIETRYVHCSVWWPCLGYDIDICGVWIIMSWPEKLWVDYI